MTMTNVEECHDVSIDAVGVSKLNLSKDLH
jgi:hypothetical protein